MTIERAAAAGAAEILALQKIVYQNEAEMYDDWSLAPLRQTLEDMRADFGTASSSRRWWEGRSSARYAAAWKGNGAHLAARSCIPISGAGYRHPARARRSRPFPRGAEVRDLHGPEEPPHHGALPATGLRARSGRRRSPSSATACTSRGVREGRHERHGSHYRSAANSRAWRRSPLAALLERVQRMRAEGWRLVACCLHAAGRRPGGELQLRRDGQSLDCRTLRPHGCRVRVGCP